MATSDQKTFGVALKALLLEKQMREEQVHWSTRGEEKRERLFCLQKQKEKGSESG